MIPMGDKNNLPLHPQLAPLGLRVFVLRSPILIINLNLYIIA
jgi:hypothetical protein